MKSQAVQLAEEMLETIKLLMAEKTSLESQLETSIGHYLDLKLEHDVCIRQLVRLNRVVESLKKELDRVKPTNHGNSFKDFTENELKTLRMLVHPDRTGKDTTQLFIKVNKLLEK